MRLQCVDIERLATVGWKWVCQPFSCPCSQHVTHCPKEICSTCLSKESIPATPLGSAKHLLPTRSLRRLRAAAHSTSSALCLHHNHPFVAAAEKKRVSCREAKGLVTELWSPRFVKYNKIVLSVVLLQTIEHLSRLSF